MLDIEKALTTADGQALIPEKIDPQLVELADKQTPLRKLIKRISWSSLEYKWNVRTALAGAEAYSETDDFSAGKSTFAQRQVTIKMLRSEGAVSNLMREVSKDFVNALQVEIEGATKSLANLEEQIDITGNSGSNAKEYDGLNVQISQSVDAKGSSIGMDLLDEAIQKVVDANGKPNLIVLSPRDFANLKLDIRGKVNLTFDEIVKGLTLPKYYDIPVVTSPFIPTNLSYGATPTSDHSYAFVLDTNWIVKPVVKDVTYEEIKATTDSVAFRLKQYLALAVRAPEMQCKIVNIGA